MIPQRFQEGLSFEQYLTHSSMNVPTMRENFNETEPGQASAQYFEGLCRKLEPAAIRVLALSEDWCGDCVENVPIVAKLAHLYPVFELRIFPRDENLDIMDQYLTEGKRVIPVFVFFDEAGEEIGRFIERPKGAHRFLQEFMQSHPAQEEAERRQIIYRARSELRKLYKAGLREQTIGEIRSILEKRYP
ncbi:MAG TPA: thioredoxin family protein [Firmicutes bacterium]|nr:thioredoxin family protein [Candidatus Fermentithermobacillaceae bacterium]